MDKEGNYFAAYVQFSCGGSGTAVVVNELVSCCHELWLKWNFLSP